MGFSENSFPMLPSKIKEQIPQTLLSKEKEDDIVTIILEELLTISPKMGMVASGSQRENGVPGAWH